MRVAKIGELKAKLSAHIEYVKRGEEVLILDRDKPVARLVAAHPVADEDERMNRLVAKGIILRPVDPENKEGFVPSPAGEKPISRQVMDRIWKEERDDR